ncbi:Hypothetical protein PENO1_086220 [Penicillium occitanis (nom. inval.)]|nr:Hypothetical protein PENO1_086220 [Penicillium occitanis (nom. inval.)]PCG96947.1 hypothetical protein PENOC_070320 [Penicillium occitanis (nom. inval.)]
MTCTYLWYNLPTTTYNAYLVLSRSQAEGNSPIFDLADHLSQDSPSPITSDHPESPSTSTSTSVDLDLDELIPSPPPIIAQQRDSFSQYTGYSPPPLHPASNGNGVDPNLLADSTASSVSRLHRRRRRSEISSSSSSSSASETSDIGGNRDVGSSSVRPPLATDVSSAGTRGVQRSATGRAEGHPPSPKRRRLANMRPNNGDSVTTANGRPDASNGLFSMSSRGKSSVNGKSSNHLHNGQPNTNGSARSVVSSSYFGHDREEVTRILIQGLYDLGYNGAASALTRESGYELESPSVVAFRSAVLDGQWAEAENLLLESFEDGHEANDGEYESPSSWGKLALAETADKNEMLFLLRQQKFLELLEARDLGAALMVLRHELTPLNHNIAQLHALSSLLMSPVENLRELSGWSGSIALSRELLLSDLSTFISPAVMIPDHRLASLLDQVKSNWVNQCLFHNTAQSPSLYSDHMCDRNAFPRHSSMQLTRHSNEVWYVEFSHDGTKLVTTSKDKSVIIYDATDRFSVIHRFYEHHDAVVFATWSPDDTKIITCSQDKTAKVWDVQTGHCYMTIEHHSDIVTAAAWAPDGETFVTASMDIKAPLCYWGLRSRNPIHVWRDGFRAQDCTITPDGTRLIASDNEDKLYVYDLASRAEEYRLSMKNHITSVSVSKDSRYVLLNLRNNQIQLMDIETTEVVRRFDGQKQGEWVIRSRFGGAGENFVVSGSEDSQIYIWHRENGALVEVLEGHTKGCVNAISWNPKNPSMFASAGDDCVVRIWTRDKPGESSSSKGRLSKSSDFTRTSALRSTTSQL